MTDTFGDYSAYPVGLGDKRSDKSGNAADWSVREMLIDILRRIDGGENFDAAVLAYRSTKPEGKPYTTFIAAGNSGYPVTLWGIVNRAQFQMHCSDS